MRPFLLLIALASLVWSCSTPVVLKDYSYEGVKFSYNSDWNVEAEGWKGAMITCQRKGLMKAVL